MLAENSQPALWCRAFKGTAGTASSLVSTSVTDAPTLADTVRATQSGPLFPSRLGQGCIDLCDKAVCYGNRIVPGSVTGLQCKSVISLLFAPCSSYNRDCALFKASFLSGPLFVQCPVSEETSVEILRYSFYMVL